MSLFRSREVAVAASGLALVVALSATAAVLSPPASEGLAPGSSFSNEADGSAAAYLTLQSLGYQVSRSLEAVASLTTNPSSTVLILADPKEPASNGDRRAVQAFVAAGGTVLVTGCLGGAVPSDHETRARGGFFQTPPASAAVPSPLSARGPVNSLVAGRRPTPLTGPL